MNFLSAALWAAGGCVALAVFIALVRGGKPLRTGLSSGVGGIAALLAVNTAGIFTGVSLGINLFTGACCLILGVPGVVALLVLKTIFQIG